ncbi:MAG: hypothetical protein WBO45_01810, partial [Planctomycetota bacterium]
EHLEEVAGPRADDASLDAAVDGFAARCREVGTGANLLHRGRLSVYLAVAFGLAALALLGGGLL